MEHPSSNNRWFSPSMVAVAVTSLSVRLWFLLNTERALDKDECMVGIMVKHIVERGEHFVHIIGGDYGGGHALLAYLMSPFYKVFGLSDIFVQTPTVLFSVLLAVLAGLFVRSAFGPVAGVLSALFISFSPPFMKASFRVNGYVETMLLVTVSALFLQKFLAAGESLSNTKRVVFICAIGITAGLALWSFEFALIFLLLMGLSGLYHIKKFRLFDVLLAASVFLIGYSVKLRYLLHENSGATFGRWISWEGAGEYAERFRMLLTNNLPRYFSPQVYFYFDEVPFHATAICIVSAAAFAYVSVILAKKIKAGELPAGLPLLLLFLPVYYMMLMPLFFPALEFPRYLLGMSIFMPVTVAAGVSVLDGGGVRRIAAVVIVAVFLVSELAGVAEMGRCRNNSCVDSAPVKELVAFLDERGNEGVYTDFIIKWMIVFYSNERIVGSDRQFVNMPRNLEYDDLVWKMKNVPYVFRRDSMIIKRIEKTLQKGDIKYSYRDFGDMRILYDFSEPMEPFEWMKYFHEEDSGEVR